MLSLRKSNWTFAQANGYSFLQKLKSESFTYSNHGNNQYFMYTNFVSMYFLLFLGCCTCTCSFMKLCQDLQNGLSCSLPMIRTNWYRKLQKKIPSEYKQWLLRFDFELFLLKYYLNLFVSTFFFFFFFGLNIFISHFNVQHTNKLLNQIIG